MYVALNAKYMCQHYVSIWIECDCVQGVLRNLRSSKDVNLNDGDGDSPSQEKLTGSDSQDLESGHQHRKRKTSQNVHSHGSFFLRVGAIGEFVCVMVLSGFYHRQTLVPLPLVTTNISVRLYVPCSYCHFCYCPLSDSAFFSASLNPLPSSQC